MKVLRLIHMKQRGRIRPFAGFVPEKLEELRLTSIISVMRTFTLKDNDVILVVEKRQFLFQSVSLELQKVLLPDGLFIWMTSDDINTYPVEPEDNSCFFQEVNP